MVAENTLAGPGRAAERSMRNVHLLLGVQSAIVVLVSINRLTALTVGYVAPNAFLRWVDFNNMLVLPLASLAAFYLLKKQIDDDPPPAQGRRHLALNLMFVAGVYLLGASYGDHEVTNYLHARFCAEDTTSALCQIVIFNDDEFSHWVFFTGFVLVNASLMLIQVLCPRAGRPGRADRALLMFNGLFIGAGVFANLAFETIGLDLYVVGLLALLSLFLLWRRGPQPLLIYYATAYAVGLAATAAYKGLG
jgi:hypothetical protein